MSLRKEKYVVKMCKVVRKKYEIKMSLRNAKNVVKIRKIVHEKCEEMFLKYEKFSVRNTKQRP